MENELKYDDDYEKYFVESEIMKLVEDKCPDNNNHEITAKSLREIFKSIIETFWKPKVYVINQENIFTHISDRNKFWNINDKQYEDFGYGHLHIPYCDVLRIEQGLIWPNLTNGRFGYLLMDNVKNGHVLKITGDFRPGALVHKTQASGFYDIWKYKEDDDFKMETVGNISRQVYAPDRPWSYEKESLSSDNKNIITDGPEILKDGVTNDYVYTRYFYIELMYWNGVWYECAY